MRRNKVSECNGRKVERLIFTFVYDNRLEGMVTPTGSEV